MYLYETHCHTKYSSACATLSAEQIIELYLANGYTGVFITDHFLNGNSTIHIKCPNACYQEKLNVFCEGFQKVKKAAENRLQIFFGLEYSYAGTDILIYGWDEKQLQSLEKILSMSMREFVAFCRESGVLAIQAHPFREAHYIDHIRLYPECEGVEIFNATNNNLCNSLGEFYAKSYNKIPIGGSDCHHNTQKILSGVSLPKKIDSVKEFIEALKGGKGQIIQKENILTSNNSI